MVLHMPLQGCNIADWGRDMTREREREGWSGRIKEMVNQ